MATTHNPEIAEPSLLERLDMMLLTLTNLSNIIPQFSNAEWEEIREDIAALKRECDISLAAVVRELQARGLDIPTSGHSPAPHLS